MAGARLCCLRLLAWLDADGVVWCVCPPVPLAQIIDTRGSMARYKEQYWSKNDTKPWRLYMSKDAAAHGGCGAVGFP